MVYGCLSHRRLRAKNDGQANYVHEKIVGAQEKKAGYRRVCETMHQSGVDSEDTNVGENITIWKKKMTRSKLEFVIYY